jgi:hypothetical protein
MKRFKIVFIVILFSITTFLWANPIMEGSRAVELNTGQIIINWQTNIFRICGTITSFPGDFLPGDIDQIVFTVNPAVTIGAIPVAGMAAQIFIPQAGQIYNPPIVVHTEKRCENDFNKKIKWIYKDKQYENGSISKFKITYHPAKFKWQSPKLNGKNNNGRLKIYTKYITGDDTLMRIKSKRHNWPMTITIGDTVIEYDAYGNINGPIYVEKNGKNAQFRLGYKFTHNATLEIDAVGHPYYDITVANYYVKDSFNYEVDARIQDDFVPTEILSFEYDFPVFGFFPNGINQKDPNPGFNLPLFDKIEADQWTSIIGMRWIFDSSEVPPVLD